MKPLSAHFANKTVSIPASVEDWIERLPVSTRFLFAVAILKTLEPAFAPVPPFNTFRIKKVQPNHSVQGDDAS